MPIAENLRSGLSEKSITPIGVPIPDYENPLKHPRTKLEDMLGECTLIDTGSPIGSRMTSLTRQAGITEDLGAFIATYTDSDEGRDRMRKFIRHHVIRRAPIVPGSGQEGPKLTGHETFFIAKSILNTSDDPNAIALLLSIEGLALQKGQTDRISEILSLAHIGDMEGLYTQIHRLLLTEDDSIIQRLQSRGFQQMPLDELRIINDHLAAILAAEQEQMSPSKPPTKEVPKPYTATDFRQRILDDIRSLPIELERIYYFNRRENVRILYAVPKLQEQIAALHAPNITQVGKLAQRLHFPLEQEYIDILYELIKMVSRGIEPVTRHILEYKQ